jgi:transglutaminase-like putative cysteine protease
MELFGMARTARTKFNRKGRLDDWLAALFLLVTILISSGRLLATEWVDDLGRIHLLTAISILLGMLIGYSYFSSAWSTVLAIGYGIICIPWQVGSILGSDILWRERMLSLSGRIAFSSEQLINQETVSDPLLFLLTMAILFWIIGSYAGYQLVRNNKPWHAIIPAGVALVVLHTYDSFLPRRSWYLAFFLLFGLTLVSRVFYLKHRARWDERHTHLPLFISIDLLPSAIAAVAILVLVAWMAPSINSALNPAEKAWKRITRPWQEIRDDLSRAVDSLRSSVGVYSDYYGEQLILGRGNSLSDKILFTVETPVRADDTIRFYWRIRVYDHYEENQWENKVWDKARVSPSNYSINTPNYAGRWDTIFNFSSRISMKSLYAISETEWISRPAELTLTYINEESNTGDINLIRLYEVLLPGETYEVQASVTNATIEQLRNAGSEYPDWVTENYLQIPESIGPRVYALAQGITQGLDNPYDKAEAITRYLRANIEYEETIPAVPTDTEAVEWLLFDYTKGFCNYYATTEIMMLRALGIPARLAVGYAQGGRMYIIAAEEVNRLELQLDDGNQETAGAIGEYYEVRQKDAHAWPEVYFPGIGWVEFEPTVSQFPISRRERDETILASGVSFGLPGSSENGAAVDGEQELTEEELAALGENLALIDDSPNIALWVVSTILVLAVIVVPISYRYMQKRGLRPLPVIIESGFERLNITPPKLIRRWARYAKLTPLERAYTEINFALIRMGSLPGLEATPAERSALLIDIFPNLKSQISQLAHIYQTNLYSHHPIEIQEALEIGKLIRNVTIMEKVRRWLERLQEPARRTRKATF